MLAAGGIAGPGSIGDPPTDARGGSRMRKIFPAEELARDEPLRPRRRIEERFNDRAQSPPDRRGDGRSGRRLTPTGPTPPTPPAR